MYTYTGSLYPCIVLHSLNNSIAFASLEEWSVGSALLLLLGAIALIALLALTLIRVGVITPAPRLVTAAGESSPPGG